MNLLILEETDFVTENRAYLSGRRLQHLLGVQQVKPGDTLKAGLLNGKIGTATIVKLGKNIAELETQFDAAPPKSLPLTLILALPRPKMLRRIFQTIATLGVKELYLINSFRVEKSYWQTPWLTKDAIREQLILGLEQGVDTLLPRVHLHKRFKPFVEDELPAIAADTTALAAHPKGETHCPVAVEGPTTLAIGPEGGFIDYEIEKLAEAGLQTVTLGQRILRVETAVPTLIARLFP